MMETAFLSLSKSLAAAALLLACSACSAEVKCPSYQGKSPLTTVTLYDGPPEEKADLMADVSRGSGENAYASWNVGYIFGAKRNLFLVCSFAGADASKNVTVKVDQKVEQCIFRTHAKGTPAELTCK
jgi:hypothetical protein